MGRGDAEVNRARLADVIAYSNGPHALPEKSGIPSRRLLWCPGLAPGKSQDENQLAVLWPMGALRVIGPGHRSFTRDTRMRQFIPSWGQILLFAAIAIVLAVALSFVDSTSRDLGLSICAMPLFVFSAVLGLRRNWARNAIDATEGEGTSA